MTKKNYQKEKEINNYKKKSVKKESDKIRINKLPNLFGKGV